jgi:hypothetical protein
VVKVGSGDVDRLKELDYEIEIVLDHALKVTAPVKLIHAT